MTLAQKELVTAWLLGVVVADGKIAVGELDYMHHLSAVCGLPNLTAAEARYQLDQININAKPSTPAGTPSGGGCMIPIAIGLSGAMGLVYLGQKLLA